MEFIDLKVQQEHIRSQLWNRISSVLEHGRYIMGPEVAELELALAGYTGAKHCIGCSSGSTALDLVLSAWNIGQGDAVLTTPLTFISTAESIARTGAVPVFVDIDPHTFNLNPSHLEEAITALSEQSPRYPLPKQAREGKLRLRAIVVVDLFGHPADYDVILDVARRHDLLVLEDGAQAFGGMYGKRKLCACGCNAATTSFFPAKPLGCYGDGGAVFTDDDALAELVDSLRYHGRADAKDKNNNVRLGMNGRLDTLQAAILLAKLDIFEEEMIKRQDIAATYTKLLAEIPGIVCPEAPVSGRSSWAQYTILLPSGTDRKRVMQSMKERGIPTAINYPRSLHLQKAFAFLGYRAGDFPAAEDVVTRVLSLPIHPYLKEEQQQEVVSALAEAFAR